MTSTKPLLRLIQQNSTSIGLTYGLSLAGQLLAVLLPGAIGLAINDLLNNSMHGLVLFVSLWVVLVTMGIIGKMYDTRIFMRIYAALTTQVIRQQRHKNTAPSKLIARSVLIREIIDFLERDIPTIFAMLITSIGSLIMLASFNWHIALIAMSTLIPVSILNAYFWRPTHRLNRGINNNLERQAAVVSNGTLPQLHKYFRMLRFLRVKTSDLEAKNWGITEIFVVCASIAIFIYAAQQPGIQAGTLFAIITYFWNYQDSLYQLPLLMQSVSQVKDISRRIQDDAPNLASDA